MRIYLDRSYAKEIDRIVDLKMQQGGLTPSHHDPKLSEREALTLATRSELALAKEIGGTLNMAGISRPGDGGHDIEVGGLKIDVKLTNYQTANLIFDRPELFRADVAILLRLCAIPYEFDIVGGISRQRFLKVYSRVDLGHGLRCVVSEFDLKPWSVIRKHLVKKGDSVWQSRSSQLHAL